MHDRCGWQDCPQRFHGGLAVTNTLSDALPITVRNVTKTYGRVHALDDVSLDVKSGEFLTLLGPSGSGKTTLLMVLAGFTRPDRGSLKFGDAEMIRQPPHLRDVGMVFQNYALFPHMTVAGNVGYPLRLRRVPKPEIAERVEKALETVQLGGYGERRIDQLSGGQKQRVALARSIVFEPRILLMDEPFSALDPLIRLQLQDQFKALVAQLKKTTLFITHDLDEAIRIGHRIAIMKDGVIVQIGTPEDIVMNPADDYVREFVQGISKLKLVRAHSIMEPLETVTQSDGAALDQAPRADESAYLDQLIDLSVGTELPVVITEHGRDVGVVTKARLLRGIQGGKDD